MKKIIYIGFVFAIIIGCHSTKKTTAVANGETKTYGDTIRIANDELEYEVLIFDPNFSNWLMTQAKPRGYYGINFLENQNVFFVSNWNNRVIQPQRYNPNWYQFQIDYDKNIRYGYEVNYLLYNYFVYFEKEHHVRL